MHPYRHWACGVWWRTIAPGKSAEEEALFCWARSMVFCMADLHWFASLTHKRCDPSRYQMHELAFDSELQDYQTGWHVIISRPRPSQLHQDQEDHWHTTQSLARGSQVRGLRLEERHLGHGRSSILNGLSRASISWEYYDGVIQFNCVQVAS